MRRLAALALLLAATGSARGGKFDTDEPSETPSVKLSGVLDFRGYYSDLPESWLRGGAGPFRYGGRDTDSDGKGDRRVVGAALPQAGLVVEAVVPGGAKVHVQTNFNSDTASGTAKIGVIEAYGALDRSFGGTSLAVRAGGLIPKISWEHPDVAWSTRYTLTPSAIGSWVGEEMRVYGAEVMAERELASGHSARLTAGGFSGGDRIGRLLWFRGWSLDDYQGDLFSQYSIQGRQYSPMEELDGRLGYYGRGDLDLFSRALQLGGGYWTNNADDRQGNPADLESQPFRTRLWHYGGKFEYGPVTIISQYLRATVAALGRAAKDWNAVYALASVELGRLRLSGRFDRFGVLDFQQGHALTAFAGWSVSPKQQVSAEFIYANQRPDQLLRPAAEVDRLVQLNWRLRY